MISENAAKVLVLLTSESEKEVIKAGETALLAGLEDLNGIQESGHNAYFYELTGYGDQSEFRKNLYRAFGNKKLGKSLSADEQYAFEDYNTSVFGNKYPNGKPKDEDDSGFTFAMVGTAAIGASFLF